MQLQAAACLRWARCGTTRWCLRSSGTPTRSGAGPFQGFIGFKGKGFGANTKAIVACAPLSSLARPTSLKHG